MSDASTTTRFQFHGTGSGYFKIWIVNLILTLLTLGIYSAWAKVRSNRYFYGNTELGDATFEYHATPMMLLKGRLIAITAFAIYIFTSELFPMVGFALFALLLILAPWIIWRALIFNARMSSYRNVRFGFVGGVKESYNIFLLVPMIPIIAAALISGLIYAMHGQEALPVLVGLLIFAFILMYFLFPYIQKLYTAYTINNHRYGQGAFSAHLQTGKFYAVYLALLGWSILLMIGFGIAMALLAGGMAEVVDFSQLADPETGELSPALIPIMVGVYAGLLAISFWGKAFVEARIRNYVFSQTQLDDVLHLRSDLKIMRLTSIFLTNALLIIFTLGLAYPWAKVRLARYRASQTLAIVEGDVNQYVDQQAGSGSALGEEVGDVFDLGVGIGV